MKRKAKVAGSLTEFNSLSKYDQLMNMMSWYVLSAIDLDLDKAGKKKLIHPREEHEFHHDRLEMMLVRAMKAQRIREGRPPGSDLECKLFLLEMVERCRNDAEGEMLKQKPD